MPDSSQRSSLSRRVFLKGSALAGAALATGCAGVSFGGRPKLRVLSIGVIGTIGGTDRKQVAKHPSAEIVGLCDVDSKQLAKAAKEHPGAFACTDYREAFEKHVDDFDAVIVAVPDHSHAPIMLLAMFHGKHVYGQKPLVHQLEEIVMIEEALAARPGIVTQMGNQRMAYPGRRAAVEILRKGMLGRAVAAHCWTSSPNKGFYFNYEKDLQGPSQPPAHLDWDLWLGPCAEAPYRKLLAPVKWRSWWEYGGNGLGDWGCHIMDVIFYAFGELDSPVAVKVDCPEPAGEHFHVTPCRSQMTYLVDSPRFASDRFVIHYSDHKQQPSRDMLGIPKDAWLGNNGTVVECEDGVLVLEASGRLEIWRNGEMTKGLEMPGLPEFPELNHWHAWVDNCLGTPTELWTPFADATRITEATILPVKATRFPGVELQWDKSQLAFTGHAEATRTIVKRDYREGFAPPRFS